MKTYAQAKEAIRDLCSPFSLNDMKKANKAVKKYFGDYLWQMTKTESDSYTIMWYEVATQEDPEGIYIGYDFWNRRVVENDVL